MKYKVLITDHDDTVVNSTEQVHYPAFEEDLREFCPGKHYSLQEFITYSYDLGFYNVLTDLLGLNEKQIQREYEIWMKYVKKIIPDVYDGINKTLFEYKKAGGIIAVSSHSEKNIILRDYKQKIGFLPDEVFGCELSAQNRKPGTYAVDVIIKKYGVKPKDILVVDDLNTGLEMAKNSGCDFAFAAWSEKIPRIYNDMKNKSDYTLNTVSELADLLKM